VSRDVQLPPLQQTVISLDGSVQDNISLNTFSIMIVSNAVTSERKDEDYLFHNTQRKALNQLVSNLRQASFHWSGYTTEAIETTVDLAKRFLEKKEVPVSPEDEALLREAIRVGDFITSNVIREKNNEWHEMSMYIQNAFPDDVRIAWSLDGSSSNPTLMGATLVHDAQKFIKSQLYRENPMAGMAGAGKAVSQLDLVPDDSAASNRRDRKPGWIKNNTATKTDEGKRAKPSKTAKDELLNEDKGSYALVNLYFALLS